MKDIRTGDALVEHTRKQAEIVVNCLESLSGLWHLAACPEPAAHDAASLLRSAPFQAALREVFEAPGEWGPAQGYYREYLESFTEALVARLRAGK